MRLIDADALKKKLFVFDMEFHDGIWLRDWRDFWHDIVYMTEVITDD